MLMSISLYMLYVSAISILGHLSVAQASLALKLKLQWKAHQLNWRAHNLPRKPNWRWKRRKVIRMHLERHIKSTPKQRQIQESSSSASDATHQKRDEPFTRFELLQYPILNTKISCHQFRQLCNHVKLKNCSPCDNIIILVHLRDSVLYISYHRTPNLIRHSMHWLMYGGGVCFWLWRFIVGWLQTLPGAALR